MIAVRVRPVGRVPSRLARLEERHGACVFRGVRNVSMPVLRCTSCSWPERRLANSEIISAVCESYGSAPTCGPETDVAFRPELLRAIKSAHQAKPSCSGCRECPPSPTPLRVTAGAGRASCAVPVSRLVDALGEAQNISRSRRVPISKVLLQRKGHLHVGPGADASCRTDPWKEGAFHANSRKRSASQSGQWQARGLLPSEGRQ